jgi:hypothetical protein
MSNLIKHTLLTPAQAAEKELIIDQLRINPRGPWVNGKKMKLLTPKRKPSGSKQKN